MAEKQKKKMAKLRERLKVQDVERRAEAAWELLQEGEPYVRVLPALVEAVRMIEPEPDVHSSLAFSSSFLSLAFDAIGTPGIEAIAERALDESIPLAQRVKLVQFLSTFHILSTPAVNAAHPWLEQLIRSERDRRLVGWAEVTLQLHRADAPVTDALLAAAADESDGSLRITALGCLRYAQADERQQDRIKGIALAGLSNEKVCPYAVGLLEEFSLSDREIEQVCAVLDAPHGAAVLGLVNKAERPPLRAMNGALEALYSDPDESGNENAQQVLAKIGRPAVGPVLEIAANREEPDVARYSAIWTLWRMPRRLLGKREREQLWKLFAERKREIRIHAAAVLAHLGEPAPDVLPTVVQGLLNGDWNQHTRLAKAVLRAIPEETILPYMCEQYKQVEDECQAAKLMHFFMDVATTTEEAARFIVEQLRPAAGIYDANMLHNAVSRMQYPMTPLLIEALEDAVARRDDATVQRVLVGMEWRVFDEPGVEAMIAPATRLLDSQNPELAFAAAKLLVRFKSAPKKACDIYMKSTVEDARFAKYVEKLKTTPAHALKSLFKLRDTYDFFRAEIVCERLQAIATETGPRIVKRADREDTSDVIDALERCGVKTPETVDYLMRRLDDMSYFDHAIGALAQMGEAARPAANKLRQMLEGPRRLEATKALGRLERACPGAEPELIGLLDSDETSLRLVAIDALAEIGTTSPSACRRILELSNGADADVARAALDALRSCRSTEAVPRLLEAARTGDQPARALYSLVEYEPFPEEAFVLLESVLDKEDEVYFATETVKKLGPTAKRLLPKLLEGIRREAGEINGYFSEFLDAIAALGSEAEPTLPVVEGYLRGRHYRSTARAIWSISPTRAKKLDLPDLYRD